jgi:tetratricopeptide (TPR) repeat protein
MSQIVALSVVGTAAGMLAIGLVLLRLQGNGRRKLLGLVERWTTATTASSSAAVSLLAAIAVFCVGKIGEFEARGLGRGGQLNAHAEAPTVSHEGLTEQAALQSLRGYVGQIASVGSAPGAAAQRSEAVQLSDVDTMVAKLVARLESQPDDVKGWKMLGWSLMNLDRPEEALRAYEKALVLAPGDAEIRKAIDQGRAAKAAP